MILSLFLEQESSGTQNAKKRKKTPKILDGKYFEIVSSVDVDGNLTAKCTICDEEKKGNIASTGNFLKHFNLKHPLRLNELKLYTRKNVGEKEQKQQQLKIPDVIDATDAVQVCNFHNLQ